MSVKLPVLPVCVCDAIKKEQIVTLNHICEWYVIWWSRQNILYHCIISQIILQILLCCLKDMLCKKYMNLNLPNWGQINSSPE